MVRKNIVTKRKITIDPNDESIGKDFASTTSIYKLRI